MARSYQLSALNPQIPYRELYKTIATATYTVIPDDNNDILIFSLGANATLNLPAAAAVEGMTFKVWNSNSGTFTVTIDPQGAELIDGVATLVLDVSEGARCYAMGGRWFTDRINATDVFSTAVVTGSTKNSVVRYTGTTATAGTFNGGSTNPSVTNRLNYEGYLYATQFLGSGAGLTAIPNTATTANTSNGASTIVARDAGGNFTSNTIFATRFSGANVRITGSIIGFTELRSQSTSANITYTLPPADGTSGQVLQTNGSGSLTWVNQTGAGSNTGSGSSTSRTLFTATAGQNTFNVSYVTGQIDVFMNGAKLVIGSDFIANNNTSVVLVAPAAANDIIETVVYSTQWVASGTNLYANTIGNIGVGTSNPAAKLHVASANTPFAIGQIRIDGANNSGNVNASVVLNAVTGPTANLASEFYIETEDSTGTLRERFRINQAGKIGVGIQTPNNELEVLGTISSNNVIARVIPRVISIASDVSITPNANTSDQYNITALSANTTINAPAGTPFDGQRLMIRIKDAGLARTLSWTTSSGGYRTLGTTLPTTTSGNTSNVIYVGCIYNSQDSFWDVVAVTGS